MKENVTRAIDHKPNDSKTCTEFREEHYLMIGDILQTSLISTHAQTNKKLSYLEKFWLSKFVNDPQIFKQGVINDPQKFWPCRNTYMVPDGQ